MQLSIIILNHNKAAYSTLLLDSLLETTGGPFEFVLVDNGSSDATPEVLREFASRAEPAGHTVQVIPCETNVGAIVGRNLAMQQASGEVFAFLDNDLVVRDRDWAERLLAALADDPGIGVISPKLVFPWEPYDLEFAGCDVTVGARIIYRGRGEPREAPEYNQRRDCPCLISACILFPREVYETVGPLDEVYSPVQFEDLDFCYRAREAGWRCVYEPAVEVYHWEHTTTAKSSGINFSLVTMRNQRTFKQRWLPLISAETHLADDLAKWRELPKQDLASVPRPPYRR
ncbi:MAG: glycosyltransferase family 2 protein [Fimbriimonadaceae bacterium]|nr:glycosyltransferase family 2 protein [Fimbriimonadaceae bacterium]